VTPPHRSNARHQDLGDITKALKATAKSLDVPVLLLCQLNRGVEGREDKRPTLADLRESGQIEEDADVVMFCYREEYYLARSEPKRRDGEDESKFLSRVNTWVRDVERTRGCGDVMVAKQRNGAVDTARMAFSEKFMRWADLARQEPGGREQ
jgi:replicative DNA helicase